MIDHDSSTIECDDRPDVPGWLLLATIGVAALFVGFVHAPQRIKLPLLSPLALGAIAGFGLGSWAAARQVGMPRLVAAASFALIAAGQVGAALETHRLGAAAIQAEWKRQTAARSPLFEQIEQGMMETTGDEETAAQLRAAREDLQRIRHAEGTRQRRQLSFAGYLASRIPAAWGQWRSPWPEVFWVTELVCASALGGWLARNCSHTARQRAHAR